VQTVRAEALDIDAKDDAERWQDYGFSANPVEGQGLVINAGGHTVVVRMDRIAERPALAAFEVAVWHREGHMVRLRAGQVVEVNCAELRINATTRVRIDTPELDVVQPSLKVGGKQHHNHTHPGVTSGPSSTGPGPQT
jgi:phage gp45-like